MHPVLLTESDKEQYQKFISENRGAFLQDWHWGDFQKSLGRTVHRYFFEDIGRAEAAAQFSVSELNQRKYLFAAGGPVATKQNAGQLEQMLGTLSKEHPGLLFARIEPAFKFDATPRLIKSADIHPHQTLVLDLTLPEEELLAQMHQKTRYNIRVAQKHGVTVKIQNELSPAGQLFAQTAKRGGFKGYPEDYYGKILEFFGKNPGAIEAKLYTAWHESDLLAANLMIFHGGKTAIYLHGGSSDTKRNMMAPYVLQWQAILDAKSREYKTYDFWGIETDPKHDWYGFSRFKLGFGGKTVEYAGTYDYVFSRAWYNVYKIARKLNRIIKK